MIYGVLRTRTRNTDYVVSYTVTIHFPLHTCNQLVLSLESICNITARLLQTALKSRLAKRDVRDLYNPFFHFIADLASGEKGTWFRKILLRISHRV